MSIETLSVTRISEYIITRFYLDKDKASISNLKLQKLLYFVQGEAIKQHGICAFEEEIEAWDYGPVVRSVYDRFKVFGAGPINRDYDTPTITGDIKIVIDTVIDKYANASAWRMVQETHKPDTPWYNAFQNGEAIISKASMIQYFKAS
jgi:uncharacterized phage-associated protein